MSDNDRQKENIVDYVLCAFAIFLFPHLEQALSEFFRVLRPGGMLAITVARDLDTLSHWYGERITEYSWRYSSQSGKETLAFRHREELSPLLSFPCLQFPGLYDIHWVWIERLWYN